ncbi:MAG: helix-turn-helix transcriptional regulator [Synergistaceae bacterium]
MNVIKEKRETACLTQEKLAEKLGISVDSVRRYENGEREPRASDLIAMSKIFSCSVDELLGNCPFPPAPKAGKKAE